jgi:peptide/nickel transport system substrate-binding protein
MPYKKLSLAVVVLMTVSLILSACATPTPEVVEKVVTQVVKETVKETVIVEGTPQVVEKEVTKVVEVEKPVEVVVTATPKPVSELVIGLSADVESLDMRKLGSVVSMSLLKNINEPLLFFDENAELYPVLAESWEQIDDTTMRFHLRQGVMFHHGVPFTAECVKYSLDKIMDPDFPAWMGFAMDGVVKEAKVVDDYTVDIITVGPTPSLLWRLTLLDIVEPGYAEEGGQDKHPMGTGPFRFVEFIPRQHFIMERNLDYWGEPSAFDRIVGRILPESGTRLAALLAGEVNMINSVTPEMMKQIQEAPGVEVVTGPTGRLIFGNLRNDRPPLDNVKVRQALNYAIDKEAIVDTILKDIAIVAHAPLSPALLGARTDLEYPYDPEKAKQLLDEAGYAGEEIVFALPRGRYPNDGQVAEAIVGYWEAVGVNVKFEQGDFASIQPLVRQGKDGPFDAAFQGWSADALDPVLMLLFLFHSDNSEVRAAYNNPKVDEILDEANSEVDLDKVVELLEEAQSIIWDDAAVVFLYVPVEVLGISDNLEGFTTHPFEYYLFNKAYFSE